MTRNKKLFLSTITIGLLAHGYRMTNMMFNADSTNYLESIGATWVTSLGRFFLPVVEKLRGGYEIPWLIGSICLVLVGLSAILIAELFEIKGTIPVVLTAGILVANPVMVSTFAYMYTADGYMLGLFFSVLSVYLCVKWKGFRGVLAGALALTVSLGFYQAFVSVTMLLMILFLVEECLDLRGKWKDIGQAVGRFALTGLGGVLLYAVVLKIVWTVTGSGTTSYMGIDASSGFTAQRIKTAFADCYIDFARYFIVRYQVNCYNVMNVLLFMVLAAVLFAVINKKKLWKEPGRWIFILGLLLLLPVAGFVFEFASEELSYTSTTMEYSLNLIYLYPLVLFRHLDIGAGEFREWKESSYLKKKTGFVLASVLLFMILFHFLVIANQAYRSMENADGKVKLLLNRMETRMELEEGYHEDMEVAVIGSCYQIPEYVYAAPMMSGVVSNIFLTQPGEYVNAMNFYLGTDYKTARKGRRKDVVNTPEFAQMQMWPSGDSIRIIDGTMVLYLSDTDIDELLEDAEP